MKILAAAVLLLAAQEGRVELRWKFEKGRELRYRVSQKTTAPIPGGSLEQQMSTTYSLTVEEVDAKGAATLRVKYEKLSIRSTGPQAYEYDSEKDKDLDDAEARSLGKIIGQSFTIRMAPSGAVEGLAGAEKLLAVLFKESPPGAGKNRENLKRIFSDDALKGTLQHMFVPLPPAAVAPGESWSSRHARALPFFGKTEQTTVTKLREVKEGRAILDQEMRLEMAQDDPDNPLAGVLEVRDVKGRGEGAFSVGEGAFRSVKLELEMTLTGGGKSVPFRAVTEVTRVEK